jgi:hypothetical protein
MLHNDGDNDDNEKRIMIRRLMTEVMVMVLRMVKIITIRIILTKVWWLSRER